MVMLDFSLTVTQTGLEIPVCSYLVIRNVVQVLYNYSRARYNVMKVAGYFVSLLL